MDAVGSEHAAICGVSEGGPMSAVFSATYPERTSALVMIGTYARRLWDKDYPWGPTREEREHHLEEIRENWGGPVGLEERAPSIAHDPEFRRWWATYLRMGASPGAAVALTRMNAEIDVRRILPAVRVPTLVLHRTGDRCLKVEEGRYVASAIPNARFVELPGSDHLPFVGDQDSIIREIEPFLSQVRSTTQHDWVLAAVLSADLGGRDLSSADPFVLSQIQEELRWFHGNSLAGNGVLAMFDGPERAVRCAAALVNRISSLGLSVRAGVHIGECEHPRTGRTGGPAIEVAAHIRNEAAAGEVVVSSTIRDLVAGSGLRFESRGAIHSQSAQYNLRLWRLHQ
jgi:class 3 adenylate cyclase